MKNMYGYLSVFLIFVMLLCPLIPGTSEKNAGTGALPVLSATAQESKIKLKTESGEIVSLSMRDYLFGVVAAEMPALYHEEALKAQAVAAYTFTLYKAGQNSKEEYDITDNSSIDQAYITDEQAKEKWGDSYEEYRTKILSAIDSVAGKTVTYDGKIALTVYTAISGGKTESAKNVWGEDHPYLTSVESVGDLLSPDYLSSVTLSPEEIKEKMPSVKDIEQGKWFSSPVYSDSGTVLTMKFGDTVISGKDIRASLGLKSANFDVTAENGNFVFTVRGYGHLVGLSQYGANYMAMQGSTYEEILLWYYKGASVS